ncbi:GNAT family N-acetyltransferase [Tardibacter chloracetimidivorans]|uniref:GNAT family N-acetyltransferase n=1 Tax=Tardibacter chloracetimidivorans TaxID=1921510 RepID=A0A1L3ZQV4_9SPHN|nr:GNAT family N-acetyltransferase [Tardibacter chloracetimidivorans]API58006.1 GNAT family N-acetyltransferase [Tardibacter chloracetimidivorans]
MIGIRPATAEDAAAIAQIYAPYVVTRSVSFEDNPPSPGTIADRMEYRDGFYPWLVATSSDDGTVLGFAYATQFRERHAYRFAVETSVYVAGELQRNGVGRMLYEALIDTLAAQGFTQAIAAISLPNDASIKLHEALGFFRAGVYREIGFKHGAWRDVGLWQRELATAEVPPPEPRSFKEVGVVRLD